MTVTHIRDDRMTKPLIRPDGPQPMVWQALCGVPRPLSSMSERHALEVEAGRVLPFAAASVKTCESCLYALVRTP